MSSQSSSSAESAGSSSTGASPTPGPDSRRAGGGRSGNKGSSGLRLGPLRLGPGLIVAAAFVGPGTVTTAAKAGATHGLGLLWVVVLSVLGAMVLQEMTSRLGTLTRMGLGEMLRRQYRAQPVMLWLLCGLILVAIGIGNAAYQTGNLMGAAVGVGHLLEVPVTALVVAIGAIAGVLLWWGSYRLIERVLVGAVAVMGLAFVMSAGIALWRNGVTVGALRPVLPREDWSTLLALIGTTIVPYNLFLHASAAAARWAPVRPRGEGLRAARIDSWVGVAAGGVVTAAVLVASATALSGQTLDSAADAAAALEAVLGGAGARIAFSVGLAAAGLTSAITAPMAAAYAISGVFGWSGKASDWSFRAIWLAVLGCGVAFGVGLGSSPTETIVLAQAANALVLPVIAAIVLIACNAKLLGQYANTRLQNVLAALVIGGVVVLSLGKLWPW